MPLNLTLLLKRNSNIFTHSIMSSRVRVSGELKTICLITSSVAPSVAPIDLDILLDPAEFQLEKSVAFLKGSGLDGGPSKKHTSVKNCGF
jgi:hypothetical protein